jgi:hypothetical protein
MSRRVLFLLAFAMVLTASLAFQTGHANAQVAPPPPCTRTKTCPTPTPPPSNTGQNPNDRDGDGTDDGQDRCPNDGGPSWNAGCPQDKDSDVDGTPDTSDRCPLDGGPAQNGGCPDGQKSGGDRDGDGAPDTTDRCPDQPGTRSDGGCLPTLPTDGPCVISTNGLSRVKVHQDPTLDSAIIGVLMPTDQKQLLARLEFGMGDGSVRPTGFADDVASFSWGMLGKLDPNMNDFSWGLGGVLNNLTNPEFLKHDISVRLWYRIDLGWVAGDAVRVGGDCADHSSKTGFADGSLNFGCPSDGELVPAVRTGDDVAHSSGGGGGAGKGTDVAHGAGGGGGAGKGADALSLNFTFKLFAFGDAVGQDFHCPTPMTLKKHKVAFASFFKALQIADTIIATCSGKVVPGFQVVKLPGSPYTGPADVVATGDDYTGTDCPEIIYGNNKANKIDGAGGGDVIVGFGGDDTLNGGPGNDVLFGGTGSDHLSGGKGQDILYGMAGDDVLEGGPGANQLYGDSFKNEPFVLGIILTAPFADVDATPVIGASDALFKAVFPAGKLPGYNIDADLMAHPGGNDILDQGDDSGWEFGGEGNDTIIGGNGVDFIGGGTGYDFMDAKGSPDYPGGNEPMPDVCSEGEVVLNCEFS